MVDDGPRGPLRVVPPSPPPPPDPRGTARPEPPLFPPPPFRRRRYHRHDAAARTKRDQQKGRWEYRTTGARSMKDSRKWRRNFQSSHQRCPRRCRRLLGRRNHRRHRIRHRPAARFSRPGRRAARSLCPRRRRCQRECRCQRDYSKFLTSHDEAPPRPETTAATGLPRSHRLFLPANHILLLPVDGKPSHSGASLEVSEDSQRRRALVNPDPENPDPENPPRTQNPENLRTLEP